MAAKRASLLDQPPSASSSDEEDTTSKEVEGLEEEEDPEEKSMESGSESEPEPNQIDPPKHSSAAHAHKTPPKKSSSASESETESDSDVDPKTITSKAKSQKPETPAKPAAKSGSKRPIEIDPRDSKRAKKNQEPEQKAGGDESKKPALQRIWSDEDEIIILQGMAAYTTNKGSDPWADMEAFHEYIKKSLKVDVNKNQLQHKIRRMKKKYKTSVDKGNKYTPSKPHEQKVFGLAKKVWGGGEGSSGMSGLSEPPKANGKAKNNAKNSNKALAWQKDVLSDMVEMVGLDKGFGVLGFSEEVMKESLEMIGGSKQAELKEKWRKLCVNQLELLAKKAELILEVLMSSEH